jgi:hypothetical protein
MDGKGRCMDNVFVERLWRSLKYEDIYLRAYATGSERACHGRLITDPRCSGTPARHQLDGACPRSFPISALRCLSFPEMLPAASEATVYA